MLSVTRSIKTIHKPQLTKDVSQQYLQLCADMLQNLHGDHTIFFKQTSEKSISSETVNPSDSD